MFFIDTLNCAMCVAFCFVKIKHFIFLNVVQCLRAFYILDRVLCAFGKITIIILRYQTTSSIIKYSYVLEHLLLDVTDLSHNMNDHRVI